ncbi:Outer membrane protein OmpA [Aquiflexum balticum DSM 16537]|uniref:Outer membrane protein OmpA n=1 Tax=Aquiflexum balticum DSM 16537 TaxID=758820 RepID=A0A1W2H8R9_9BACT|nr:OmpA family protein [Aquiflexum balticum]SMD45184.1 Outer membrane protein OmpA [Aquiflexum balticum DSM 16537]
MRLNPYSFLIKASSLILLAFSFFFSALGQELIPLRALNSPYDEQNPVFSPTGEIFYSIGFHPENLGGPTDFGDVWMSKKDSKGEWQKPQHVSDLSSSGNDVLIGFSDALTALVYHSGNNEKRQGIHQYTRFGNSWNHVKPIEMGNFKNNGVHFSGRLLAEQSIIVMAMNSFGSFGNEDIYISFRQSEGAWSSPFNMGSAINSFAQEQTPYLSADLQTIYFSSNIHGNRRGKDIYFAQRKSKSWDDWTQPQKIENANSIGSELGYVIVDEDEEFAIFTTTQNSDGFGDFMMVKYEPKEPLLALLEEVDSPVEAIEENIVEKTEESVAIISEETQEEKTDIVIETGSEKDSVLVIEQDSLEVNDFEKVEDTQVSIEHEIIRVLDAKSMAEIPYKIEIGNDRGVKLTLDTQQEIWEKLEEPLWTNIVISSKGFIPRILEVKEWESIAVESKELLLQPAMTGTSIILNNIQFNRGTSDFADARSVQVLDNLVAFMKENQDIKIRLEGHTDNAGDPSLNKDLSMKRASKIRGYLTINGIDFERVRISGWGGSRPIADNQTEEGRNLNRRVEMLIEN